VPEERRTACAAVAVAATWDRGARMRSKKARIGPVGIATDQAASPSMWRASEEPAFEMWPCWASEKPDWRTRGSRPR